MNFLIDNSLSPRFARGLLDAGHSAVHVRDFGMADADDEVLFDFARQQTKIIVTEDSDFGTFLALRVETHPSVILFRCTTKSVDRLLPILLRNLPALEDDLCAGAVVVFEDTRIRVRRLPIR